MPTLPFGTVLKAVLIAGLAAGLTTAVFHLIFTEPLVDRAVALEEAHAEAGHAEAPLVSRETQKRGLVVGFTLLGLAWAALYAGAFHAVQRWLPGGSRFSQALLLAILAFWAVAFLPFLKYPANPPGMGDPETINARQALYAGFLVLSIISVLLSGWVARAVAPRLAGRLSPGSVAAVCILALGALLLLAMPAATDEGRVPADLLRAFRFTSVAGLAIFWGTLGLLFGKLITPARTAG